MSGVEKLFEIAVNGSTKAERRNAFRQLREIAIHGDEPDATEARKALAYSAEYLKRLEAA